MAVVSSLVDIASREVELSVKCASLAQDLQDGVARISNLRKERDRLRLAVRSTEKSIRSHAEAGQAADQTSAMLQAMILDEARMSPRQEVLMLQGRVAEQDALLQKLTAEQCQLKNEVSSLRNQLEYESDVISTLRVARDTLISAVDEAFTDRPTYPSSVDPSLGRRNDASYPEESVSGALQLHISDLEVFFAEWQPLSLPSQQRSNMQTTQDELKDEVLRLETERSESQLEIERLRSLLRSHELALDAARLERNSSATTSTPGGRQFSRSSASASSDHRELHTEARSLGRRTTTPAQSTPQARASLAFLFGGATSTSPELSGPRRRATEVIPRSIARP